MRFCSQYKTEEDLNSCLSRESELRYSSCVQGQDVTNENSSKEISCHNCTECYDMTPMFDSPCWGPDSSEECCISLDACYVNVNEGTRGCLTYETKDECAQNEDCDMCEDGDYCNQVFIESASAKILISVLLLIINFFLF